MRWNPWHGCRKLSEGCRHCYVYRIDSRIDKDASEIKKNISSFNLPIAKTRSKEYKYPAGTLFYTCFTSDFFLEEADDYSFPPFTGSYLRLLRIIILLLSVISTPLW